MGLRCLLGHDFTEPEIEREREEEGAEVVTTVREVKTCVRCDETQIVSENTEVTTIEQLTDQATTAESVDADDASEPVSDPAAADASAADTDPSAAVGGDPEDPSAVSGLSDESSIVDSGLGQGVTGPDEDSIEDDAVILDDGPEPDESGDGLDGGPSTDRPANSSSDQSVDSAADQPGAHPADASAETDLGAGDEDVELIDEHSPDDGVGTDGDVDGSGPDSAAGSSAENAETDDGVILDDGEGPAGDNDREHGAWPTDEEAVGERSDPSPWPEQRGEDEGYSAEVGESGDDAGVEFGGLTPESPGPSTEADPEAEYVEAPDDGVVTGSEETAEADAADASADDSGSGITHGTSPDLERSSSGVAAEYYCPECGMTTDTDGNSMRAGDICPECKRGYVDERPR